MKLEKNDVVTFVVDSVLHLWAFDAFVGIVMFVGATFPNGGIVPS